MSNPLLQPSDRFRRPSAIDATGRNRFADEAPIEATAERDVLSSPLSADVRQYQPQYTQAYGHRARFVLTLGLVSFLLTWALALSFTDYLVLGVVSALLGVALALATLIVGYRDLSGMSVGAVDAAGRGAMLLGFRLAACAMLIGVLGTLAVVWAIVRGIFELIL